MKTLQLILTLVTTLTGYLGASQTPEDDKTTKRENKTMKKH